MVEKTPKSPDLLGFPGVFSVALSVSMVNPIEPPKPINHGDTEDTEIGH